MGRRKIEIKAIKDDRNRSVTFLKRKGGLFKKAHELSVLCSVEVAVIIFAQNRKVHTYSSGNLQATLERHSYHNGVREDKGPADFADKDAGDDEEEDEAMGSPGLEEGSPPHPQTVHFPGQPAMHHLRHGSTPQNSPPLQNGMYGPVRVASPQPQGLSRPSSRNGHRRVSSNLVPQNHPHPQASQPQMASYGYHQNQQYYQARPGMQAPYSNQSTPHMHQGPSHSPPPNQQHHAYTHPAPPQSQMQQIYLQEQRRQSMPPNFPMQADRPQSVSSFQHQQQTPPPQFSQPFPSPPMPGSPPNNAPGASRSHSIYTPIDDSRSMLAQHWGGQAQDTNHLTMPNANGRSDYGPRSHSVDVGAAMRGRAVTSSPRPPFAPQGIIQRARSPLANCSPAAQDSPPSVAGPASRVDSMASDAKRPRLTVQIPAGASSDEADSGVGASTISPDNAPSGQTGTPLKGQTGTSTSNNSTNSHSKSNSVVLPPPSPSNPTSATTVLSPAATGPSNPFARPPPPVSQHPHALNTNVSTFGKSDNTAAETATPISALPSRFMSNDGLLPSPSSFYPEWGLGLMSAGGGNGVTSPSALFQPTPVREGSGWGPDKMEVESSTAGTVDNDAIAELERRMKRKVISPTDGSEDRGKRGKN